MTTKPNLEISTRKVEELKKEIESIGGTVYQKNSSKIFCYRPGCQGCWITINNGIVDEDRVSYAIDVVSRIGRPGNLI